MKILVTGAAGFLGTRVIEAFLTRDVHTVIAVDLNPCPVDDPRVQSRTGSLTSREFVTSVLDDDIDVVYHLAAVLSGQSEAEFDLGMQVNVDATRLLLEGCRSLAGVPRFIFTSSLAVFGGELPQVVPENFVLLPQSSYGAEKAIGELLVLEYSRRGFVDGVVCRLPTISVRPGKPNSAASSFVSGIIREPLSGVESVCPVPLDTRLWISSPGAAVNNLIHAAFVDLRGGRRELNLPGITVTAAEMLDTLERIGGASARSLVRSEEDPRVIRIVCSWPGAFDVSRALDLGFQADPNFDSVVRQYISETSR